MLHINTAIYSEKQQFAIETLSKFLKNINGKYNKFLNKLFLEIKIPNTVVSLI